MVDNYDNFHISSYLVSPRFILEVTSGFVLLKLYVAMEIRSREMSLTTSDVRTQVGAGSWRSQSGVRVLDYFQNRQLNVILPFLDCEGFATE